MKLNIRNLYLPAVGLCALLPLPLQAVVIPPRADAYISSSTSPLETGTNFGPAATLKVDAQRSGLLKFFLFPVTTNSAFPNAVLPNPVAAADIEKATLYVYATVPNSPNPTGQTLFTVSQAVGSWRKAQ